jgi:mannose-6-phosphate isomerase-like protein (cupin superfamily)
VAAIRFVRAEEREFLNLQELAEKGFNASPQLAEHVKRFTPETSEGTIFTHHEGTSEEPQLNEVRMPPNIKVDPHAHGEDEIMAVVEGEIRFGKQVYGVGSSIFIPRMTLYSFQSGPDGLTFLNFRPRRGTEFYFPDELMAKRGEAKLGHAE